MTRQTRIQVTVSPEMSMALGVLSERTGLSVSAQAMVLLRQSLERTMQSAAVKDRVARRRAQRSNADWHSDVTTEHMVETVYREFGPATVEEEAHIEPQNPRPGRKASVRSSTT